MKFIEKVALLTSVTGRSFFKCAAKYRKKSHAQLKQDLFALGIAGSKRGGFFVEFGAGDGTTMSNSYFLEKQFGWRGIVAEPSKSFTPKLRASRSCKVDNRCVWSSTGDNLIFSEVQTEGELSTLSKFKQSDRHNRSQSIEYNVETVSLNDLLDQYQAPTTIDYLSIDTEGSELDILQAFKFNRAFGAITVEHNFQDDKRDAICSLLVSHGYKRVLTNISQWDDWYINAKHQ